MSITAYVGLPGSGKSYNVVKHVICPSLQAGRHIVTNIPLNLPEISRRYPDAKVTQFSNQSVKSETFFDEVPHGCVFILDECWRAWPAGLKANNAPESHKSFLAEHRHRVGKNGKSLEIVLVTQDLAQVAAFARQLVETTYQHRKLGEIGAPGTFSVGVYAGAVTGQNPPEAQKISTEVGRYSADVFSLYQSHTLTQSGSGDEKKTDGRANLWRSPKMIAVCASMLIFPVLAIWFGVTSLDAFAGSTPQPATKQDGETTTQNIDEKVPGPKQESSPPRSAADKHPFQSWEFTLLGSLKSANSSQTYLRVRSADKTQVLTLSELAVSGIKYQAVSDLAGVLIFPDGSQRAITTEEVRTHRTDVARAASSVQSVIPAF